MEHPEPGDRPPPEGRRAEERRTEPRSHAANRPRPGLDRPPGDRYLPRPDDRVGAGAAAARPARGLLLAVVAGVAGAVLAVLLEGLFSLTLGLVVVAALIGRLVVLAMRAGAGDSIRGGRRVAAGLAIALASVALAQVGLWLYARWEGGALGLVDYLGQTFGPLVPLQLAVAGVVAWWTAR